MWHTFTVLLNFANQAVNEVGMKYNGISVLYVRVLLLNSLLICEELAQKKVTYILVYCMMLQT